MKLKLDRAGDGVVMHVPPVFVAANHVYVAVYLCVWRMIALAWGQLARRPQAGTAVTKTPRPEWADTVLIPNLDPEPVPRRNAGDLGSWLNCPKIYGAT